MKDIILQTATVNSIIHCGDGVFEKYAKDIKSKQFFIVTDSNVFAIYRNLLWETFGNDFPVIILPAGEKSKTHRNLINILMEMLKHGMKRNCYVVAFGGGVVGDIAGLAASLYMRGVHLVQIPTTLLSQVDSSVGGKTAVDLNGVKNVIGTFYQPEEVIADPRFLQTLPDREIRCGLGEIVKYGALSSEIYCDLIKNICDLKNPAFLERIIFKCIEYKAAVVKADERDLCGVRKSLNMGHTTGHAFELFCGKKSHGEFVLIGMLYELYIAQKYGICGGQYAESIKKLILSVIKKAPIYENIEKAAEVALHDKKNEDERVSLVVPKCEGEWAEIKISVREYAELLTEYRNTIRENRV